MAEEKLEKRMLRNNLEYLFIKHVLCIFSRTNSRLAVEAAENIKIYSVWAVGKYKHYLFSTCMCVKPTVTITIYK